MITLLITAAPVIGAFFMFIGICSFTYLYFKVKQSESSVEFTIHDPKPDDMPITVK